MPKLRSLDDLSRLREQAKSELCVRQRNSLKIMVGMGTCGIAAGAHETMQALEQELRKRNIDAQLASVGCIGMCSQEPLVDIQQPGQPRVTYANVHPNMVPRLIEEHLVNDNVVREWAFGLVSPDGIGTAGNSES